MVIKRSDLFKQNYRYPDCLFILYYLYNKQVRGLEHIYQ